MSRELGAARALEEQQANALRDAQRRLDVLLAEKVQWQCEHEALESKLLEPAKLRDEPISTLKRRTEPKKLRTALDVPRVARVSRPPFQSDTNN